MIEQKPASQDSHLPKDEVAVRIDEIFANFPFIVSVKLDQMAELAKKGDTTVNPPWGIPDFYSQNGQKKRSRK